VSSNLQHPNILQRYKIINTAVFLFFFFFLITAVFLHKKKKKKTALKNKIKKTAVVLKKYCTYIKKIKPSNYQEGIMAMIDHPSCYNSITKIH
jgi:hypothetical protein